MKFDFLSESDQAYFIHKASTLVEALPFIREHSGDTIVIKYGGHAMGDPKLAKSFARDIGLIKEVGIFPVVIHGGGPQIAEKLKTKNITSKFVDGLRVTDAETVCVGVTLGVDVRVWVGVGVIKAKESFRLIIATRDIDAASTLLGNF